MKLVRSIRYTRPRQLAWRAVAVLRRRAGQALRPVLPERWPGRKPVLAVPLPDAVLPVRGGVLRAADSGARLDLVGLSVPVQLPMRWEVEGVPEGPGLERFLLHYMEWVDGLDDERALEVMADWIAQNPRRGAHASWAAWSPYAVALRCIVWMETLARRGRRPSPQIADSLGQQLRFVEWHLERDLGGNHLLKDAAALLLGARFFQGPAAQRWRTLGTHIVSDELDEQVLADGVHFERSPAYHHQVWADLIRCHAGLAEGAVRSRLAEKLDAMARAAQLLVHPDGAPSLFADGGLAMALPHSVLRAYWPCGSAVDGGFSLPDAGYWGFRGSDELFLAFCGRIAPDHLPAHGHGDILAFEWSVAGQRMVVDTGVFHYHEGARRERSRSTVAHNTVTVADADQAEFYGSFRVGRRPDVHVLAQWVGAAGVRLRGEHFGFGHLAGRPIHERRFEVEAGRVSVQDSVRGGSGQAVHARLLLHPDVVVRLTETGAVLETPAVTVVLETDAAMRVIEAPWYPDFGVECSTHQLVLDYGFAPTVGGFVLRAL